MMCEPMAARIDIVNNEYGRLVVRQGMRACQLAAGGKLIENTG